jgi:hypothetical protein
MPPLLWNTGRKRQTMAGVRPKRLPWPSDRAGRLADLLLACMLAVITFPLMVFVAIAITCNSRGPIFSSEERVDASGRRFSALKFRTTVQSCTRGPASELTFVGGIIWHLRIDNLPQLVNVLRGEMSCIKGSSD